MHFERAFFSALCCTTLFACVDDDEEPANATDASIDATRSDAVADSGVRTEAGLETSDPLDTSIDAEAGFDDASEQDSGSFDTGINVEAEAGSEDSGSFDAADPDGGVAGPAIWLAYIADLTPDVDELWAVRVHDGIVAAPLRINAPLEPNQNVTWMRWTDDGKKLAYRRGTWELFVVDMTGPAPEAPKLLADVDPTTEAWSPDGRYLAYLVRSTAGPGLDELRVVDLSQPTLSISNASFPQSTDGYVSYAFSPRWSADSQWMFGRGWDRDVIDVIWGAHVRDGALDSPTVLLRGGFSTFIDGYFVAPIGARFAAETHVGGRGTYHFIRFVSLDQAGGSYRATADNSDTYVEGWLASGDLVYRHGYGGYDFYLACGNQRMFDGAGTVVSFKPSPDVATLAVVVDDANPSVATLYLRKRLPPPTLPEDACWQPPVAAISDFSTLYEWAPDSRNLLYAKSSLYVLDTAGSPLPTPRELVGSIAAGATATSIAWGHSSNRIFYTTNNSLDLNYIDYRVPAPLPVVSVTPGFAHADGDAVAWQLSPTDSYVASRADFAVDGVSELYVSNVAGNRPAAPQRVNAPFSATQDVTAFAWQPVILTPP